MLYLIFSLVVAWLVYSIVSISTRYAREQKDIVLRIEKLEEKLGIKKND